MKSWLVRPTILVLVACGPGDSSTAGTDSSSGSTTTTAGTGSSGPSGTAGTGSGSGGTGGSCPDPGQYFVPGCGEPSPGDAPIEAGCHVPCSETEPCASGTCVTAWVDPCYGSPCGACGGQQGLCMEGLPTGVECESDDQCQSGVCWDFSTYDACCFGTVCSGMCETNQDCIDLATGAGAETPDAAVCGPDGRCDLVSTGLGSFACANDHMCG